MKLLQDRYGGIEGDWGCNSLGDAPGMTAAMNAAARVFAALWGDYKNAFGVKNEKLDLAVTLMEEVLKPALFLE